MTLTSLYPHIAHFVNSIGWIEVGYDDNGYQSSFIRALDMGGLVWEGQDKYENLDVAFQELDAALARWMSENGIEMKP